MLKLHPWRFGVAMAITVALLYSLCALAVALYPDATIDFFNAWFHGLDLMRLKPPGGRALTAGQYAYGLASATAVGFVFGAVLAALYNLLARGEARERLA